MKQFLYKIVAFSAIMMVLFTILVLRIDGYSDPFYVRFTTPKQDNLILGTSRSAQGILPSVLKEQLKKPFFNYAFTVTESPFGPAYYESIKRKLGEGKNSTFIIEVQPWSLCALELKRQDTVILWEENSFIRKTQNVNQYPNLEYILESYYKKYYQAFFERDTLMYLHNDGWLQVNITMDSLATEERMSRTLMTYKQFGSNKNLRFSELRYSYLKKTIDYLKQFGNVYLVRMPVHPVLFEMGNKKVPSFNLKMEALLDRCDGYLDMTPDNESYIYTDGNHLHKSSGRIVSQKIAEWITDQEKFKRASGSTPTH